MGEGDRLRAAVDGELGEDVLHVVGDGLWADDELGRDVDLSEAFGKPLEYGELALGEARLRRSREGLLSLRASEESAHAGEQLVRVDRLDQVVVGADQQAG